MQGSLCLSLDPITKLRKRAASNSAAHSVMGGTVKRRKADGENLLSLRSKIVLTGLSSHVETFLGIAPDPDLWDG